MPTEQDTLQVNGLGKRKLAAVAERAKRLGMTPQRYLRHLVEEDLAVSECARSGSFEQLLGSGQAVDEAEVDRLVESARKRYQRRKVQPTSRKG